MDFVEICNVCIRKVIGLIKAAKRIFNSDKICRNCDFYFGVTFLKHTVSFKSFPIRTFDLTPSNIVSKFTTFLKSED